MYRYRTSINFSIEQIDIGYTDKISHPFIIHTYNSLLKNYLDILEKCQYVSIRVSPDDINVWIHFITKDIDNDVLFEKLKKMKEIPYNVYLNNKYILGDEYVLEEFLINETKISQYQKPYSFVQVYKYIRLEIYKFLEHTFKDNIENLVCIGGEFYLYSQILKYKSLKTYTDCNDLYSDCLFNSKEFPISLVDYTKDTLGYKEKNTANSLLILNVSRNGLKRKLLETVLEWRGHIVYIGCKKAIVDRDTSMIKKRILYFKNFDDNVFLAHLQ